MKNLKLILLICAHPVFCLFSESDVCYYRLVTDFSQDNCTEKTKNDVENKSYYYARDSSSCLPKCQEYTGNPNNFPCSNEKPCVPGFSCEYRCYRDFDVRCTTNQDCMHTVFKNCKQVCVADPGSCMSYWSNIDSYKSTYFSASVFKPSCTNDGKWKAKQCKGGVNGRCFCFDDHGKRLFGETMFHKSNQMTCACSSRKAALLAQGRSYVSFHCDSLGNYEKLQCDSGLCWCAEPKTGKVIAPVVPMKAMIKLPCYEFSQTGNQYYRKCDSVTYALATITETLKRHGVKYPNIGSIVCDGDGSYGPYTVKDGAAYCTSSDGARVGSYSLPDASFNLDKLNCNCARDKQKYNYKINCLENGNYNPLQTTQSNGYYCVDDDGFPKTDMFDREVNCTEYY